MQKKHIAALKAVSANVVCAISAFLSLYGAELIFTFWLGKKIRVERIAYFFVTYIAIGTALGVFVSAVYVFLLAFRKRLLLLDSPRLLPALNVSILQLFLGLLILNTSFLPLLPIFSPSSLISSFFVFVLSVVSFFVINRWSQPPVSSLPRWRMANACAAVGIIYGTLHALVSREIGRDGVSFFSAIVLSLLFMAAATVAVRAEEKVMNLFSFDSEFSSKKVLIGKFSIVSAVLLIGIFVTRYAPSVAEQRNRQEPFEDRRMPDIIILVMDTVRQDRMSTYGCERETTPNITKFARQSLVFDAYSTISWTLGSHASIVTGKYPTETGAGIDGSYQIDPRNETLAEILGKNGYSTAAIIANAGVLSPSSGFQQGFDYYFAKMHETEPAFQILAACLLEKFMLSSPIHTILFYERAERVNEEALRWIKEDSKRPFFLFINYMDAHDPYVPPPPYDRLWYKGKPPSNLGGGQWLADVMNRMDDNGGGVEPEREYLLSQYDGGLAYLDAQIGIFLGRLKEMGIFDDSLIVITSDHGEFLAEHGLFHHPAVVYQQGLRIPLIIKPPAHSNEALKKYPPPVSLVNLFPLILHYAGVNRKELDAASLLESSTIFSEGHLAENFRAKARFGRDLYSLIENNFKLIYSSNHVYELYNLSLDPFERQNLFAKPLDSETRNLLSRMKAELSLQAEDIYVRRIIAPALPSKEQKDIRERLRALGYIQ